MEFGKLADISQVNFKLAEEDPRNAETWTSSNTDSPQMYVGLPRWASKEWIGQVYPKKTPQSQYLQHYALTYNTIELNSTHYRIPKHDIVRRWKEMTPPAFRFCPKIPQSISHYNKLLAPDQLSAFIDSIALFEDRLGCSFVQLPEYFGPHLWSNFEQFIAQWPTDFRLAVEFRHKDWFDEQLLIAPAYELLARRQMTCVITDVSGRRDVSHSSLPFPTAMLRFVANGLHPTDYDRFQLWISRIKAWQDQGLQELYFFVHQPEDIDTHTFGQHTIQQFQSQFPHFHIQQDSRSQDNGEQMSLF